MPAEIKIGEMLLATACNACKGTGWQRVEWVNSKGGEMTLVEETKCDKCFRGTGWVPTEDGYSLLAFIELVNT